MAILSVALNWQSQTIIGKPLRLQFRGLRLLGRMRSLRVLATNDYWNSRIEAQHEVSAANAAMAAAEDNLVQGLIVGKAFDDSFARSRLEQAQRKLVSTETLKHKLELRRLLRIWN